MEYITNVWTIYQSAKPFCLKLFVGETCYYLFSFSSNCYVTIHMSHFLAISIQHVSTLRQEVIRRGSFPGANPILLIKHKFCHVHIQLHFWSVIAVQLYKWHGAWQNVILSYMLIPSVSIRFNSVRISYVVRFMTELKSIYNMHFVSLVFYCML